MEEKRRGGEEEERRRAGEQEERRGDLLLFTRVLRAITNVLLLFARVFKWYPLKPIHFQGGYVIQMLKPMHRATKNRKTSYRKCQKLLKPRRLCTKDKRKEDRTTTSILAPGRPSDKDNVPHAPAQLRLIRTHGTHETKTKTRRSRSPG